MDLGEDGVNGKMGNRGADDDDDNNNLENLKLHIIPKYVKYNFHLYCIAIHYISIIMHYSFIHLFTFLKIKELNGID